MYLVEILDFCKFKFNLRVPFILYQNFGVGFLENLSILGYFHISK